MNYSVNWIFNHFSTTMQWKRHKLINVWWVIETWDDHILFIITTQKRLELPPNLACGFSGSFFRVGFSLRELSHINNITTYTLHFQVGQMTRKNDDSWASIKSAMPLTLPTTLIRNSQYRACEFRRKGSCHTRHLTRRLHLRFRLVNWSKYADTRSRRLRWLQEDESLADSTRIRVFVVDNIHSSDDLVQMDQKVAVKVRWKSYTEMSSPYGTCRTRKEISTMNMSKYVKNFGRSLVSREDHGKKPAYGFVTEWILVP